MSEQPPEDAAPQDEVPHLEVQAGLASAAGTAPQIGADPEDEG